MNDHLIFVKHDIFISLITVVYFYGVFYEYSFHKVNLFLIRHGNEAAEKSRREKRRILYQNRADT